MFESAVANCLECADGRERAVTCTCFRYQHTALVLFLASPDLFFGPFIRRKCIMAQRLPHVGKY